LAIYDFKGNEIGTVVKPEKVTIGSRKRHTIDYTAELKPSFKEILNLAGDCVKHNQTTTFKVEGNVKGEALGFGKRVHLGPFNGESQCITPQEIISQVKDDAPHSCSSCHEERERSTIRWSGLG